MPTAPVLTPAPAAPRPAWRTWRSRLGLLRPLAGVAILALLAWRLGTGPFLAGLRLIDGWTVLLALGLGALTTVCSAWRWSVVAGGLGLRLPLRTAVAGLYRAVFLNATLPGGVLGDVHRAVRHGRDAGDVGRGIRAVVWERAAGQVVQLALALAVLSALPSPVHGWARVVARVAGAAVLGAVLLSRARLGGSGRMARALGTVRADLRGGLLTPGTVVRVLLASVLALAGHLALFLVAARTAGATAPLSQLVPLALLALLAMAVPANVGGFGPREGVAAWAFGAAGLSAGQGVAAAVVYGALVLVASLPGAVVLARRRRPVAPPEGAHLG